MARRRDRETPEQKAQRLSEKAARKRESKRRRRDRQLLREEKAVKALKKGRRRGPAQRFLGLRELPDLADAKSPQQRKYWELVLFLATKSPRVLIKEYRHPLERLAKLPWERELADWEPKGKGRETQFRSLVTHLVERYPTPHFLLDLFFLPNLAIVARERRAIDERLYLHIAQGGSVKKAISTGLLPTQMTKKMMHTFMQTPKGVPVMEAVRGAQLAHMGGDTRILRAFMGTQIGQRFGNTDTEAFWLSLMQWVCNVPMLDPDQIGPIFDWVMNQRGERDNFSMKGRTGASVLRGVEEWHNVLAKIRRVKGESFTPSGFARDQWEIKKKRTVDTWTCDEILFTKELAAEGRSMSHCVYSYGRSIQSGRVSIWSLKLNGERQLTIEVQNREKRIVQAKGKCNARPTPVQRREMERWATRNKLSIGAYV